MHFREARTETTKSRFYYFEKLFLSGQILALYFKSCVSTSRFRVSAKKTSVQQLPCRCRDISHRDSSV